ncbi:galactokinase [Paenibacillus sp. N1-5-1-14]|uniref:galactokinase n=1 Tax=Paenibacillus radicibacter TaxID=2972488 RepID=UPI002158D7FF|nr:galactokinase [Paenibacillus radicibacter]MCR8642612.1 galactokinase [Paenibacillus radicibacter]
MEVKLIEQLKGRFVELYGGNAADIAVYHAPGRVNLIGEHIDYNGGYVFPAALTIGTALLFRRRTDDVLNMASEGFALTVQKSLSDLNYQAADDWSNFPKGVISLLNDEQAISSGFDMLFYGNIPNGSGLSSSASIEVLTAYAILDQENREIDRTQIALLAQQAENEYIGVKCGIMDQFAIAQGKKDHAVLLRCNDLNYDQVPFESGSYQLVIGNTNKRRELAHSAYNERRGQCEAAVEILRTEASGLENLKWLADLSEAQYSEVSHVLEDEVMQRRARHVVEENARVLRSVELLRQGNLEEFGKMMTLSHESLRDLYEVSCRELDVMVDTALQVPGVLGARMTGAGFGGCTVSLVHEDHVEEFIRIVGDTYNRETGLTGEFYVSKIGDGVRRVE